MNAKSVKLITCPHCNGQPTVIRLSVDNWSIECLAHPVFPVKVFGESMNEAVEKWNDRNSWEKLGALS